MLEPGLLMFQIGVIMLIAFLGAAFASRLKLSVIIGYIVAGIFIGPNMIINFWGFQYNGFIQDTEFILQLSHIGLILLLFFVGLEFSVTKLRRTKEAAMILAIMNVGLNMFAGFVIGTYLGWPLIDTIFLAGVISMSSSAVTAKALIDLKRLSNTETEFLLGMVILESFMAMFLLTMVNGLVISSDSHQVSLPFLLAGIVVFISFFTFLAVVLIPRVVHLFEKIKSDELFILFSLGIVFLSAALAEAFRIPAIIGAFFIGMVFADTKLSQRFSNKMVSLRDAFVAVFFLSFGMMIDPQMFPKVIDILILAIPLIILNDVFLTAVLAYFIGFSGKAALSIGASLIGRNEESVLYATIGTRAINSNPTLSQNFGGKLLSPFAGILCIVMSSLTPIFMKKSAKIASFFERILPSYIAFGGDLVKKTLKAFVMPAFLPLYKKNGSLLAGLLLYFAFMISLMITSSWTHFFLSFLAPLIFYVMWVSLRQSFDEPVMHTNYGVEQSHFSRIAIENFVLEVVLGALVAMTLVAIAWQYLWLSTLFILLGYFIFVIVSMKMIYRKLILGKGRRISHVQMRRFSTSRAWSRIKVNYRK